MDVERRDNELHSNCLYMVKSRNCRPHLTTRFKVVAVACTRHLKDTVLRSEGDEHQRESFASPNAIPRHSWIQSSQAVSCPERLLDPTRPEDVQCREAFSQSSSLLSLPEEKAPECLC